MTKMQRPARHRFTGLVNVLYAQALLCAVAWCVLLLIGVDAGRLLPALLLAAYLLLPLAFGIDIWHTNPSTKEK